MISLLFALPSPPTPPFMIFSLASPILARGIGTYLCRYIIKGHVCKGVVLALVLVLVLVF